MKLSYLILLGVFILGLFVRLWHLESVPASLNWDEVSMGYNAYSLLNTGKDEYGSKLPASIRSFNDYKPPLLTYLMVPFIYFFGLTEFAVRLPSALLGSLSILIVYLLISEGLKHAEILGKPKNHAKNIGFVGSLLFAISPWSIQFSRGAFEANIALFFILLGVWLFFKSLNQRPYILLSAISFACSLYAYHSARIFVPLLIIASVAVFRKKVQNNILNIIIALGLSFLICLPLLFSLLNPEALNRLRGTSVFSDQTGLLQKSVTRLIEDKQQNRYFSLVANNRRLVWVRTFANGYLSHFSLKWLFLTGDNPRHHAPDTGLFYLWQLPFILVGLYFSLFSYGKFGKLCLYWLLLAPLPASFTTEVPHAIRTLSMLPPVLIFCSIGLYETYRQVQRFSKNISYTMMVVVIGVALFSFTQYLCLYFTFMNKLYSEDWQYGRKEAVNYVKSVENNYENIIISWKIEQPYIFFLYYLQYDPVTYLNEGGTFSQLTNGDNQHFGKYHFRQLDIANEKHDGKTLYVGLAREIPGSALFTTHYLDGSEALKITN